MIKLSASIIGRNEQDMLPEMLETIKGIDEIVFIDTGSEDDTVKIAKKAGATVYTDYKWNDHFSEARNVAKDRCTGDWLLIIDCDEKLIGGIGRLKQFLDHKRMKDYDAVFFDVDTGQEVNQQMRLLRNTDKIKWVGAAHNLTYMVGPQGYYRIPPERIFNSSFEIKAGYSPAHKKDPDRTLRILTKELKKGPQNIDGGGQFGMNQFTRYLYYVAREWLNRQRLPEVIYYLEQYIGVSPPTNEKADVHYILATCYIDMGQTEKGLDHCMMCLKLLPSHKAAWALWINISAPQYKKYLMPGFNIADNAGVLFRRREQEKILGAPPPVKPKSAIP